MSPLNRRAFLGATALGALAACAPALSASPLVLPTDPRVREVEAARRGTGRVRSVTLTATAGQIDLGGPVVDTWTTTTPHRDARSASVRATCSTPGWSTGCPRTPRSTGTVWLCATTWMAHPA